MPETASEPEVVNEQLKQFRCDFSDLTAEVGKIIVGQHEVVRGTLIALIAGGHVLLEGVPGLGKTMLVRTLAAAMHLQFARVQFTPDLMPADLLGTSLFVDSSDGSKQFQFQKGPLFTNVLLADEINRATPKTQSALLEAMAERSVTVAGKTMSLPSPFLVLATQNPLEMEGTYPLPEAQLDRFFVNLIVKYPSADEMSQILNQTTGVGETCAEPVINGDRILQMRLLARQMIVGREVQERAIGIVMGTHPDQPTASTAVRKFVRYGASPRGAQALILYAKILAILDSRFNVSFEDIRNAATPVLRHRLILNFEGQAEAVSTDDVLNDLLDSFEE